MSDQLQKLQTKVKSVHGSAQAEADLVSEGLLNSLSVIFGVRSGCKLTISHFNSAPKHVCIEALKCLLTSLPQIKATCSDIIKHVDDLGVTCLDIQKELDVYKEIMNKHSENFSKASALISQIKPMISKVDQSNLDLAASRETLNQSCSRLQEFQRAIKNQPKPEPALFDYSQLATHLPKPEPPVLDYARIAAHLPKPEPPVLDYARIAAHLPKPEPPVLDYVQIAAHLPKPEPPVLDYAQIAAYLPKQLNLPLQPNKRPLPPAQPSTNFRKQMKKSSDELQKRNNLMIYGLSADDNCSVKNRVVKMFKECRVQGISSSADNVVSAHVVSSDKIHSAIRVVMSNHFIVSEILAVARELKASAYNCVYLSKDRTPEERERHKKCVEEMKKKLHDFPGRRWAIVGGAVIDKGSFVR